MARPQTTQHPAVQTSFSLFGSLFFRCCGSENDMYNRNIQLIKPGLLMTEYSLRIVFLLFLYLLPAAFFVSQMAQRDPDQDRGRSSNGGGGLLCSMWEEDSSVS